MEAVARRDQCVQSGLRLGLRWGFVDVAAGLWRRCVQGLNCVFIDVEHALDPSYSKAIGVNMDTLYVSQPGSGEEALEIADTLVRTPNTVCARVSPSRQRLCMCPRQKKKVVKR